MGLWPSPVGKCLWMPDLEKGDECVWTERGLGSVMHIELSDPNPSTPSTARSHCSIKPLIPSQSIPPLSIPLPFMYSTFSYPPGVDFTSLIVECHSHPLSLVWGVVFLRLKKKPRLLHFIALQLKYVPRLFQTVVTSNQTSKVKCHTLLLRDFDTDLWLLSIWQNMWQHFQRVTGTYRRHYWRYHYMRDYFLFVCECTFGHPWTRPCSTILGLVA